MRPPMVVDVIIPSSHKTVSTIAMVHNIIRSSSPVLFGSSAGDEGGAEGSLPIAAPRRLLLKWRSKRRNAFGTACKPVNDA